MFTGIIEVVGEVSGVAALDHGCRLEIAAPQLAGSLQPGDSVAVDGVCLTVVQPDGGAFTVEVIGTTISRTNLGDARPGRRVNLERALRMGDRLGGHLVQGHIDGVGEAARIVTAGEHVLLDVHLPPDVEEVTVLHGSIAINGVSLTVNALPGPATAQVALIPYTMQHTNLRDLARGDLVNLEGDMLGRFVTHYLKLREDSRV